MRFMLFLCIPWNSEEYTTLQKGVRLWRIAMFMADS